MSRKWRIRRGHAKPHVVYPHDVGYLHILDHMLNAAWRRMARAYYPLSFKEDRYGDLDINLLPVDYLTAIQFMCQLLANRALSSDGAPLEVVEHLIRQNHNDFLAMDPEGQCNDQHR